MYAGDLEIYRNGMDELLLTEHCHENPESNDMNLCVYGKLGLMCPNCFNVTKHQITISGRTVISADHNNDIAPWLDRVYVAYECPACKSHNVNLIELDPNIADAISILNKKGYRTLYCCEGHGNESIDAYIYFESKPLLDKFTHTIPITWYVDYDWIIKYNKFIIRSDAASYAEAMLDIYEWAKELPDLSLYVLMR